MVRTSKRGSPWPWPSWPELLRSPCVGLGRWDCCCAMLRRASVHGSRASPGPRRWAPTRGGGGRRPPSPWLPNPSLRIEAVSARSVWPRLPIRLACSNWASRRGGGGHRRWGWGATAAAASISAWITRVGVWGGEGNWLARFVRERATRTGGVVEGRMAGAGGDEEVGGDGGGGGRRRGWDGREREVWVGDRGIWEEVAAVRSWGRRSVGAG